MVKIKIDKETKELQKNAQSFITKNNYDGDWLKFISYAKNIHNCHPLDVDDDESAHALVTNYIRWIYEDLEAKILKGISEKEHRKKIKWLKAHTPTDRVTSGFVNLWKTS